MWRRDRDRHCSDEELLGHLDGEISRRQSAEVESHLQRCWECRARSARLNEQSQALARLFATPSYLGPDRLARGKALLHLRQNALERELAARTGARISRLQLAVAGAAALAVILCAAWFLRPVPSSMARIDAGAALRQAGQLERAAWSTRPVHQVYSVEILQEAPVQTRQVRRLDIWDDPIGGRYSSTLRDSAGYLQYGLWAPGGAAGYEMESASQGVAIPVHRVPSTAQGAADRIGAAGDGLESAFKAWLKERHWQRLTLASDFAAFASEDAVVLTAEKTAAGVLRLTARRLTGHLRLTAVLELDSAGRPRFHSIRVETAGLFRELRLREEQFEALTPGALDAQVFQPSVPVAPGENPHGVEAAAAVAGENDLGAEREVEAYYALHRAGACLKETLEVNREAGGRIGLRLLAGDAARASELRAVLSRVASSPYLDVDIQIGRPRAHARAVASVQAPAMTMVERWNGVWDEGLALVELANHLGANTRISLTPESRLLLRTMLRDHAEAMSARIASVRAILAYGSSLGEAPAPALSEDSGGAGGDWRNACLRMFQAIDRVDPLIETDSVRPEGIPAQELPLLHESLSKVDYWAGVLIRNGNSLRLSVSSAPGSGDATARNSRLAKGAPR